MPEPALEPAARRACASSARWWSRSPAAPTPPSWPGWPTTPSAPTAPWRVTAVSPSLPARRARTTAPRWPRSGGCAGRRSTTDELDNPDYARNDGDRCYWCKDALMDAARPAGRRAGRHRRARREPRRPRRPSAGPAGGRRARARRSRWSTPGSPRPTSGPGRSELGLATWDKPAAACLASRLPYGTPVTLGRLGSVERAEAALRALGFAELRVRHYGDVARIEVPDRRPRGGRRRAARPSSPRSMAAGYRWVDARPGRPAQRRVQPAARGTSHDALTEPDDPADALALRRYADALLEAVTLALPGWVERVGGGAVRPVVPAVRASRRAARKLGTRGRRPSRRWSRRCATSWRRMWTPNARTRCRSSAPRFASRPPC